MIPPIALTSGEPAGVGPELAWAAWQALKGQVPFFWIGDPRHLPDEAQIAEIATPAEATAALEQGLPVIRHEFAGPATPGQLDQTLSQGVIDVIIRAVDLVQSGHAGALCTAPIHKQALQDGAGFQFPGHTEFLAHLAGVDHVVMMLSSPLLRVVPATIHIPLHKVAASLTETGLEHAIRILHHALQRDFGCEAPRIAVAGLNPHAGEGGKMGIEETTLISPLLERLRKEGMTLIGPLSADTMFHPPARATYDAALAMYHDQALIPIKTLDFDRGVNVTLGLPFVRTSPDHGTALDLAGTGKANPQSLIEALKLAQQMAQRRTNVTN